MRKLRLFTRSLTFNIIAATTLLLFVFCMVVSTIGYIKFTDSLTKEYTDSAYRTAETAAVLVDSDKIEQYLQSDDTEKKIEAYLKNRLGEPLVVLDKEGNVKIDYTPFFNALTEEEKAFAEEYYMRWNNLNTLCDRQNVTIIYVVAVDTLDYGHYYSVFNCLNKTSPYTRWVIGYEQESSYQDIYKGMYENNEKKATIMRTTNLKGAPPHVTSLIPLYKSDGTTVAAVMCVQRPMSELSQGRRSYMVIVALFTLGLAILFIVASTLFMRRQFVNPIKKINAEAARFAKTNSAPDKPILDKISRINEISSLATALGDMESETLKYIDNLSAAIAEKQRMGTELQIASLIQEGSLSSEFPAFPERTEFDLYASMNPAKEVGGDFYDFFLVDDDHLALVMADVSGKGVPAALFMMVSKILINDRAIMGGTPAEILAFVNDRICEHNKAEMFVTVWLGIFEISTGKLTFANAGHDDPACALSGKDFELVKRKHGLVIGAMSGAKYTDTEITLSKGDKIFLYTDGVPEATDKDKRLFTINNMIEALNAAKAEKPEDIIGAVRKKVDDFVGDAPQFDDITMLCFEYKGKGENSITLTATDENLAIATGFILDYAKSAGASEKFMRQAELFVEEIFVNVAHYAYAPDTGDVKISAEIKDGTLKIVFVDHGKPYNPLEKSDPDTTLSADEREIGGLGIYMAKKLTDNVEYMYEDGKNILILEKKLG